MLAESLVYARSYLRTPPAFRPFLVDAVGLWARGHRQANAWAPHLTKAKAVIESALGDIASRRTVAVLGAGPLLDVPLEILAGSFEQVLLIDLAHLSTTDKRIGRTPNVERVWRDLAPVGDPAPLAFLGDLPQLDWVISINLLSQIARAAPDDTERAAIDAHLGGLSALRAPATLITDVEYRIFDPAGKPREQVDMMHGRTLPPADSHWLWEVAPLGEEARDTRRLHTVHAYPNWHTATRRL